MPDLSDNKATEGLSYEPCGVTYEGEPNLPCVLIKNHDEDTMHVDRFGGRWCE